MDLQELYNTASGIIENLRTAGGSYSVAEDSSVCVLLSQNGNIYSGLTGTKFENGELKTSCSEYNAVVSMMTSGETRIVKMITVLFRNGEVIIPCEECRNLIFNINNENRFCEIAVSKSGTISLKILMPDNMDDNQNDLFSDDLNTDDFMENDFQDTSIPDNNDDTDITDYSFSDDYDSFDSLPEEVPVYDIPEVAPPTDTDNSSNDYDFDIEDNFGFESSESTSVDYVTNVTADESNPFYEPPVEDEKKSNIIKDGNIEFEMYDPTKRSKITKPKALYDTPVTSLHTSPRDSDSFTESQNNEQYQPDTSQHSYYSSQNSVSNPTGDSAEANSIYKQRLNSIFNTSMPSQNAPEPRRNAPKLSKLEMMKSAKEKKRLAKIDAKFQRKIKRKGY